jgi:MFS family permease
VTDPASTRSETRRANATVFLLNTADATVTTLIAPFLASRGYEVADIGFIVGIFGITSLLSRVPAGWIANGPHVRRLFLLSTAIFAAAVLLYPVTREFWALLLVRLVHGLFSGTAATLNFATFLGLARGPERVRATALYTTAMSGGYTLGNFSSGILADHFGYGLAFALAALCPAAAVLVGPRAQPSTPLSVERQQLELPLRQLLRRIDLLAIPVLSFCVSFCHNALNTLFPLYVLALGQTLSLVGIARGFQSGSNTVVRPFGEPLVRRFGVVGLACLGLGFYGLSVAAIPLTTLPLLLVGLYTLLGACRGFVIVANNIGTSEISERGVVNRGTAATLVTVAQDLGTVVAPIASGLVAAQIGLGPALQVLPLTVAIFGVLFLLRARASTDHGSLPRSDPGGR